MNKPVQYITFVEDKFSADEIENLGSFLETNGLAGTEMFWTAWAGKTASDALMAI